MQGNEQKAISPARDRPRLPKEAAIALSWARQYTHSVQRAAELAPIAGYKSGLVLLLMDSGRVREAADLGESGT